MPPALQTRAASIYKKLAKLYPDAHCALHYKTPLQLLVATILSAQCTDARVNIVTKPLFRKYKSVKAFAEADLEIFQKDIHSTGFFRNKTKNILAMANKVRDDFGGKIPQTMAELITLPGVARKTANVVLGEAFHKSEGIAVDTHVIRLTGLLKLSKQKTPEKIEQDLMRLFPQKDWAQVTHLIISHGRKICIARRPKCGECGIAGLCPSEKS